MTVFAYMRVSTDNKGQTTDNQKKLIVDAGFTVNEFISEDGVSGSKKAFERPAFKDMMTRAKQGDTVIVTAVDRLGRNTSDVLNVVEEFKRLGIRLRVTMLDGVDLTSSTGKLLVTMMAALAEMEKNLLIERTKAGLERTKAAGTKLGRSLSIAPEAFHSMSVMKANGASLDHLSRVFGVPRNTIHRNLKDWAGKFDEYTATWNQQQVQQLRKAA